MVDFVLGEIPYLFLVLAKKIDVMVRIPVEILQFSY
uniref:Uncharacterized protein n=1 Tax=Ralstonia solanacearum TaxID=305 RepID=A0A0S4XAL9_RALSL|nr:protein of unknown function [Ralstonia solanacearum]CUV61173.1 protein of unknown function [Ralstonia solanacearum]